MWWVACICNVWYTLTLSVADFSAARVLFKVGILCCLYHSCQQSPNVLRYHFTCTTNISKPRVLRLCGGSCHTVMWCCRDSDHCNSIGKRHRRSIASLLEDRGKCFQATDCLCHHCWCSLLHLWWFCRLICWCEQFQDCVKQCVVIIVTVEYWWLQALCLDICEMLGACLQLCITSSYRFCQLDSFELQYMILSLTMLGSCSSNNKWLFPSYLWYDLGFYIIVKCISNLKLLYKSILIDLYEKWWYYSWLEV